MVSCCAGDLRSNRWPQWLIRFCQHSQYLSGRNKGTNLQRGRGGQGLGGHGELPFDPLAFNNFGVVPHSTLARHMGPLSFESGVRKDIVDLLAKMIRANPTHFPTWGMLKFDGIHVKSGRVWHGDKVLGHVDGVKGMDDVLGFKLEDMANEVIVFIWSTFDGSLFLPIACFPVRGYGTVEALADIRVCVDALTEVGLTTVSVSSDGLSLPALLALEQEEDPLIPIPDYPHTLKTLLAAVRLLRSLELGTESFSLMVIIREMGLGNFSWLTISKHINPEDAQSVSAVLALIGPKTVAALRALTANRKAQLLADYLELLWRFWLLFDIKRMSAEEPNPYNLPIMSVQDRLVELRLVAASLRKVLFHCILFVQVSGECMSVFLRMLIVWSSLLATESTELLFTGSTRA